MCIRYREYTALDDLIATSDIITLHIPLTQKTRHLIGSGQISRMKQGAILINTARGGLVDEKALADAVREGRLLGAGIDCVEEEPLSPDEDVYKRQVLIGLFIGGMLPFLFAALTMDAVGKAAQSIVVEVRRQFKSIPGLMEGKGQPDYAACVDM